MKFIRKNGRVIPIHDPGQSPRAPRVMVQVPLRKRIIEKVGLVARGATRDAVDTFAGVSAINIALLKSRQRAMPLWRGSPVRMALKHGLKWGLGMGVVSAGVRTGAAIGRARRLRKES